MKYKLSICMMVKDEEVHLMRCLESMKDIIDRDDVELIIVDTGSTDETISIAKAYTDKIYYKKWFEDFSGMRNISISYAKGEWIFIIDADEAIEDLDKFINFLDHKSSKQIKTYFLKTKNYTSLNNKNIFALMVSPRIFKNDGTFKYEGTVHNQPIFKKPTAVLDVHLGHYGYLMADKHIMDKKFFRTVSLLKKELKVNPNNIYYQIQLATSYNMHGDIQDSYNLSKKTYEIIISLDNKRQLDAYAIFSVHIFNCLKLEKYNETIDICKKAILLMEDYVDAYFAMCVSYEKLGKLEMAKEYAIEFLDLCERYSELEISKNDEIIIYRNDITNINNIKLFLASYFQNNGEYELAVSYLKGIELNKTIINIYISSYLETGKVDSLRKKYDQISEKDMKKNFFEVLEEKIKHYNDNKKNKIRSFFLDVDENYSLYGKFCLLDELNIDSKRDISLEIFKGMDKESPNIYYADILTYIFEREEISLKLFNSFNKSSIFYYLNHFYNNNYNETYIPVFNWIKNIDTNQPSLKNEITLKYLLEGIVIRLASEYKNTGIESTIKNNLDIFKKYIEVGLSVIGKIYNFQGMSLKYDYINDLESKFLILINLYYENLSSGNTKAAFKYYKLATETYPEFSDFMGILLKVEFKN